MLGITSLHLSRADNRSHAGFAVTDNTAAKSVWDLSLRGLWFSWTQIGCFVLSRVASALRPTTRICCLL